MSGSRPRPRRPRSTAATADRPRSGPSAAVNAALAWPLGKLLLRGRRMRKARGCSQTGRVRRKNDLITPFTSRDSPARMTDRRIASSARWSEVSPRAIPTMCQSSEKSPSSDAPYMRRSIVGWPRVWSKMRVDTVVERADAASDVSRRERLGQGRGAYRPPACGGRDASGFVGITAEGRAVHAGTRSTRTAAMASGGSRRVRTPARPLSRWRRPCARPPSSTDRSGSC